MPHYLLQAVGSDMEVFLHDRTTGHHVPVCGLLGGTKEAPIPIPALGHGFAVQEDNVAAEVNIPPATTAEEFSQSIGRILRHLNTTVTKRGLGLNICPAVSFPAKDLQSPQALTLGCEPDFNVWLRQKNAKPNLSGSRALVRTAAAHVHVSFLIDGKPPASIFDREPLVKALDLFLSVPFTAVFASPNENMRRSLYGMAGAFRPKPYGIEHRVLSNLWISNTSLRKWVFNGVQQAIAYLNDYGPNAKPLNAKSFQDVIMSVINKGDASSAFDLCRNTHVNSADYRRSLHTERVLPLKTIKDRMVAKTITQSADYRVTL